MYALVDCNNFYCSCEKLFNPGLEGRPVIVLSNNDGCAISRTEEAKALGIAMAAPVFMMRKLIEKHNVVVYSSNYTLYGDISRRIMETLSNFVPGIEMYSIDEAFLDLRGMGGFDLLELGGRIRSTIGKNIGLPVSIGIAATKSLAKMANRHARKNYKKHPCFGPRIHHGSTKCYRRRRSAVSVESVTSMPCFYRGQDIKRQQIL